MNQKEQMLTEPEKTRLRSIKERESKWYFKAQVEPDSGHMIAVGFMEGIKLRDEQALAEPNHFPDAKKEVESELVDAHRTLSKWINEEIDAPIDRQALAKVLAATQLAPLVRLTKDQIREICLANGFTVKEGQSDLKPYVFEAARALMDEMAHINVATIV